MTGREFTIELRPQIPEKLSRLQDLAGDLYFSWDRYTRGLFYYLDPELWETCRHNPKVFLRRVSQKRLEQVTADRAFLEEYERTLAHYDVYCRERRPSLLGDEAGEQLVAYFCAEFGLHESLPVYSGGLGILAGDFCKAASDLALPFVAVGLLYRAGNLVQTIDHTGRQETHNLPFDPEDLPITAAPGADGNQLTVDVDMPDSKVRIAVWHARVGHTGLYLLDTDMEPNAPADRALTQELYPADKETRLRQEIVLGIGGVRALRALGIRPSLWHINEGHPCLLLLERCRELVKGGMAFHAAVETAAAATVFTTHTPVTAGHEIYDRELIRRYFAPLMRELGAAEDEFLAYGANSQKPDFNLTTFTLRWSRFHNAVSRIHRGVAAALEQHVWPEITPAESPVTYVNNGIHVPTFLARDWYAVLNDPGWHNELRNPDYWRRIDAIPDATFWSVRQSLKRQLMQECECIVGSRCRRHGQSRHQIECATDTLRHHSDVLVIGFARRFATYKRATLLFEDPERLRRILGDPQRPVLLLFAGRAHPSDEPGKELIRQIHEFSNQPGFLGRVLLLEGYDLALARKLVAGADLWVNVPEFPMEASGTSGMKAAINGAVNLSILDGWWAEAYDGHNGWAVQSHVSEPDPGARRRLEAQELLDTLEHRVIPLYFDRKHGYPEGWIRLAKRSMQSVIPRFNSERMVADYVERLYRPAVEANRGLQREGGAGAAALAQWKAEVRKRWYGVSMQRVDDPTATIKQGTTLEMRVAVQLNGLRSEDVVVQCLAGRRGDQGEFQLQSEHDLVAAGEQDGRTLYHGNFALDMSGLVSYRLRAYPFHPLLCHRFEMGFMKWI